MAPHLRASLVEQVKNSKSDEIQRRVYEKTAVGPESEVGKQWASGPFSEKEMSERLGPRFLPCRRFGITQGVDKHGDPKIRAIDDCSEYFHNACVSSTDKANVAGVDTIASFIKIWSSIIDQYGLSRLVSPARGVQM